MDISEVPDERELVVLLLRPLLTGVRVTTVPKSTDPTPLIIVKSKSSRNTYGAQVQHWTITLLTAAETRKKSRDAAVAAHLSMLSFGSKVTSIPGIGWIGTVEDGGGPEEYAGGEKLFQHIARYRITVRPDISDS
jgi:hypothetical protein